LLRVTATDDEPPAALSVDHRAAIAASKTAAARDATMWGIIP
jgi:hypothetical protein